MADKKLNEVSQLTDFDYALVVKGNDVAKVTKQQLATILGGLLPVATNSNKGLAMRTACYDLVQGKLYKLSYKAEIQVYKPVICLLYVLKDGISSYYAISLSGYRGAVSYCKLICGNEIQFKLYQKLNNDNYFDFILECPDNSGGFMEIKAINDLTVSETTESLSDWQQIVTE